MPRTQKVALHPSLIKDALYFTDGGRILCTDCLGFSARITARDISGQKIERVKPDDAVDFRLNGLRPPECEDCGKGMA